MMSKHYLFLVLFVIISASLFATESRMDAMGGMNGYVKDNTDVFTYPGTIWSYERYVTAEMRTSSSTSEWSIGTHIPIGSVILGVYFNEPTYIDVNSFFYDYYDFGKYHSDYDYGDLDISKKLDIILGLKNGLAFSLGMAMDSKKSPINYSEDGEDKVKDLEMSATYFEIKAGKSTEKMDLGLTFIMPGGKVENPLSKEKADFGGFGVQFNGRYYFIQKDNWSLCGLGDLGFSSGANKRHLLDYGTSIPYSEIDYKDSESDILFNLRLGINYNVTESTLLAFGIKPLGLVMTHYKDRGDYDDHPDDADHPDYYYEANTQCNTMILPEYKVGLESAILPWLTLRVGATQTFILSSETLDYEETDYDDDTDEIVVVEDPQEKSSMYDSIFSSQVGFGFKFGDFTLDTLICNDFLFDGPDFVGGTAPGLNTKLSLGYKF